MQPSRFVVDQLGQQYEATLEMLGDAVEKCPDALWEDRDSKPAYWHEAYHALFWCDNFVGNKDKLFERCPVGVDIDPRLFANPGKTLSKAELLDLVSIAGDHVTQRFARMMDADLEQRDEFGKESPVRQFDVVLHRILYALRHGQHHIGKLAARLGSNGASLDVWRG